MMRVTICLAVLGVFVISSASAQKSAPTSYTAISPIFSQLVMFTSPLAFVPVFEKTDGPRYIRESVLKGETVERWSQMITVNGAKGLASNAKATPEAWIGSLAAGFKSACPETFTVKGFGPSKFGEHDAFIAVASCGSVGNGPDKHSETALLISVRGAEDLYTLQWAERGPATGAIPIDEAKWQSRLRGMQPIRLCPIVPGERAPYPSCLNKG